MEGDFSTIFWVIIAVGAVILQVAKAREKAEKAKKTSHEESWPTTTAMPATANSAKKFVSVETSSLTAEEETPSYDNGELQTHLNAHPDAPEEENEAILADFDLRKAVIYSEILNPKFKE